jgi:hypothetical protein
VGGGGRGLDLGGAEAGLVEPGPQAPPLEGDLRREHDRERVGAVGRRRHGTLRHVEVRDADAEVGVESLPGEGHVSLGLLGRRVEGLDLGAEPEGDVGEGGLGARQRRGREHDGVGENEAGAVGEAGERLERGLAPGVEVEEASPQPLLFEPHLEHGPLRPTAHLVADGGGLGERVEALAEGADEGVGALELVERVVGALDLEREVERERVGLVPRDLGGEVGRAFAEGERAGPRHHLLDAPLRPLRAERGHERVRERRHRNGRVRERADLSAGLGAGGGFEPGGAERGVRLGDLGEEVAQAERGGVGGLGPGVAGEGGAEGEGAGQQRRACCAR